MVRPLSRARLAAVLVLFALCLMLTGCKKSKITQENYDKIKDGMTLAEVEAILGEGTSQGGDGSLVGAQAGVDLSGGLQAQQSSSVDYVWEKDKKSITVTFRQGKVANKRNSGL